MSRLSSCFDQLARARKTALVAYVVAGDYRLDLCVPLMHILVEQGVDIIELGYPFTDPAAEGPVIQAAHERALAAGAGLAVILEMLAEFRESNQTTPVVLMGYLNPVECMGYSNFAGSAARAGADGALIVDLPLEAARQFGGVCEDQGLDLVLLATPTTSATRLRAICSRARGYLYYVTLKGLTGADSMDMEQVRARLGALRSRSRLPVCVGFGIKTARQVATLGRCAEGVVVGSVLVDAIASVSRGDQRDDMRAALSTAVAEVLLPMRRALDE